MNKRLLASYQKFIGIDADQCAFCMPSTGDYCSNHRADGKWAYWAGALAERAYLLAVGERVLRDGGSWDDIKDDLDEVSP